MREGEELTELLKRWADLEPDRCLIGPPTSHICAEVILGAVPQLVLFDQHKRTASQEAALLVAVIEAIEARGWSWELRGSGCPSSARVTAEKAYGCVADEPTDPPAFPLLGAYLAALEAEKAEVNRAAIAEQEHGWRDR